MIRRFFFFAVVPLPVDIRDYKSLVVEEKEATGFARGDIDRGACFTWGSGLAYYTPKSI